MRSIERWQKALCVMLLLVAGAGQAKAGDAACGQVSGPMTMSAAVQHVECQVADRRLLIVGEIHGTTETPALVAELVKAASKNRPVRLGLEWPAWMQSYVATYLASQGTLADRQAMMRMGYWKAVPDGRGSEAMVDLVDAVRVLRKSGRDVDIFLMEPNHPDNPSELTTDPLTFKENGMAKAIKTALDTAPKNVLAIAEMGRAHSRYVAMAEHPQPSVLQQMMDAHPLYIAALADAGGEWICRAGKGCGPYTFKAPPALPSANVQIEPLNDAPIGLAAEVFDFSVFTPSVPEPRADDGASKARSQ